MKGNGVSKPGKMDRAVAEAREDLAAKKSMGDVLALSDEELDKELSAAGVDLKEIDKKSKELYERFEAQVEKEKGENAKASGDAEPESQVAWEAKGAPSSRALTSQGKPKRRDPYTFYYAAAAAVATASAVAYLATRPKPEPPPVVKPDAGIAPQPPPTAAPIKDAKTLRSEAFKACEGGDYRVCLSKLDVARMLDEDGDRAPEVERWRKTANQALFGKGSGVGP